MLYFTRWKALAIILTALVVCLFAVPNFFPEATVKSWPKWAQRHLVLGLDLQGGSHILLEVDANYVTKDTDFASALSKLRELSQPLGGLLGSSGQRSLEVADAGGGLYRMTVPQAAITERIRQSVEQSIQIVE